MKFKPLVAYAADSLMQFLQHVSSRWALYVRKLVCLPVLLLVHACFILVLSGLITWVWEEGAACSVIEYFILWMLFAVVTSSFTQARPCTTKMFLNAVKMYLRSGGCHLAPR